MTRSVTILEMLIALVLTLLIMAALVNVFDLMGDSLRKGRATIQMAEKLRYAARQLQRDLDGLTVATLPWVDEGSAAGYLEIVEGQWSDETSLSSPSASHYFSSSPDHIELGTALGDIDDVLQFTTRSMESPFHGLIRGKLAREPDGSFTWQPFFQHRESRFNDLEFTTHVESPIAEVRWWVDYRDYNDNEQRDPGEPYVLMRRHWLVRPDIKIARSGPLYVPLQPFDDVATAIPTPGYPTLASLADLSLRENRYSHLGKHAKFRTERFPYPLGFIATHRPLWKHHVDALDWVSEHFIVLEDILSFDVRVYDPLAPLDVSGSTALAPGEPGYRVPENPTARGAFVDLNYARDGSTVRDGASIFSGPPHPKSQLFSVSSDTPLHHFVPAATYDTWPSYYERDGLDQDEDGLIDEGTNGIDDDNTNGVDDPGERETSPPYPVPLTGIEVRIRIMDHNTRQVRQVSIVANFTRQ